MIKSLFAFIPSPWILNAATLGKIGFWGKMPGTNGSFVGLIYYTLFFHTLSPLAYLLWAGITTYIACVICTRAELLLGKKDPSCVILDEMVAIPFCFLGLQFQMQIYPVWAFTHGLTAAEFGDSELAMVGDDVYAIGKGRLVGRPRY